MMKIKFLKSYARTVILSLWVLSTVFIPQAVGGDPKGNISFQPKYFEFPTETWIIEKQDYFGTFLEWNFIPIDGQHSDKRLWNFTWRHLDFLEVYNETSGEPLDFIVNPIFEIRQAIGNETWLIEIHNQTEQFWFKTWGDFKSDVVRLDKYDVVPEDIEEFGGKFTTDIFNFDNGSFLVSFKDKWKVRKKITIGFGSTITYSGVTNTITCTGGTEGDEITFWDLWNASNVNAWNAVNHTDSSENAQFDFGCRIIVGDGTETWFADTEKQITFNSTALSANSQILMDIKNNAHFRLGEVLDVTDKLSYKGCQFIALDSYLYCNWVWNRVGGDTQIYSSSWIQANKGVEIDHSFINDDATEMPFWNNIIDHGRIGGKWDISHTIWQYGYNVISYTTTGDFRDSFIFKPYHAFYFYSWYGDAPIKNVIVRQRRYKTFRVSSLTIHKYLVNIDSDYWDFFWIGTNTKNVYRQYTFDLTVTYPNGTAIQNANVTVSHYGENAGQDFTELTDSNGKIAQKTLTKGFYNQTGGNTIYSYEPFNIQISNITGYQTYEGNFTLPEKKGLIIALQPTGKSAGWMLAGLAILALISISVVIIVVVRRP